MRDGDLVPDLFDRVALDRLRASVALDPVVLTTLDDARSRTTLHDVEVLVTGWGAPRLDGPTLDLAPQLRLVVHTGGTVRKIVTPELWERGVRVSSSASANAQPVAEYTLAMVLLAGKRVLEAAESYTRHRSLTAGSASGPLGNNGLVVGVVGASRIGRQVLELLHRFDVELLLHDPWVTDRDARALGATATGLDDLMRHADVVTVHAPELPETRHLIGRRQLALMRSGTTLVNTARGSLVDTEALTQEVLSGRLRAVLDVTDPEPLPPEHPLFTAPGALLTPHVAGSLGNELRRLGASAVAEVARFVAGEDLVHEVRAADLARTA
ncbi:hydroxyacid dehydrogenase [Cellulomonas humilata]|uniref:Hydroxyacid dehydrogenase n=2 Tax=Cellulomonas humilata TaxID=144055 RepID=A0A7Y6A2Q8_9CELL|nr:hydroxyacid dehydrogenase [Cellulomonas humilata]NUU18530.1 hydroxyacid dehydrogenase [Cellulomonas humilata]